MRQNCERKIQQQGEDWVSLLMEIKLKEKLGMQSTFSNNKVGETCTVPTCVTIVISPLGNLTKIWTMEVIEVKELYWMNHMVCGTIIQNPITRTNMSCDCTRGKNKIV